MRKPIIALSNVSISVYIYPPVSISYLILGAAILEGGITFPPVRELNMSSLSNITSKNYIRAFKWDLNLQLSHLNCQKKLYK